MVTRTNHRTGRKYELLAGYSRAVKMTGVSSIVAVGGTTSTTREGEVLHPGDAYAQTLEALTIIRAALDELGATMADVVRTRLYVVDMPSNQDAVGRAHLETFGDILPAETMVGISALAHPDMLVEIEVEAML